jgi:hypothetical protein
VPEQIRSEILNEREHTMKKKKDPVIRYCLCGCGEVIEGKFTFRKKFSQISHRDKYYKEKFREQMLIKFKIDEDPCISCIIEKDCVKVCLNYQLYHNTAITYKANIKFKKNLHKENIETNLEHINA